jgi:hypothetical protein
MRGFEFQKMRPANSDQAASLPPGVTTRVLKDSGKAYIVYLRAGLGQDQQKSLKTKFGAGEVALRMILPPGKYRTEWHDTKEGRVKFSEDRTVTDGTLEIPVPEFEDDIALTIRARCQPYFFTTENLTWPSQNPMPGNPHLETNPKSEVPNSKQILNCEKGKGGKQNALCEWLFDPVLRFPVLFTLCPS